MVGQALHNRLKLPIFVPILSKTLSTVIVLIVIEGGFKGEKTQNSFDHFIF